MQEIKNIFEHIGGRFIIPFEKFVEKCNNIKAFIFDWDGVFNSGAKGESNSSNFSEIDSMGTNMLRFGLWLTNNQVPPVAIITGEENKIAINLTNREHFNEFYFNCKNKRLAFNDFIEKHNLKPNEVAFCFDDILDLSIAELCGLKFQVKRSASPLFDMYCINNNLSDYITSNNGANYAVREISELFLGTLNVYDKCLTHRISFDETYSKYLNERNNINPNIYYQQNNSFIKINN